MVILKLKVLVLYITIIASYIISQYWISAIRLSHYRYYCTSLIQILFTKHPIMLWFLNGFVRLFTKIDEMSLVGFPYDLSKILMALNKYWFVAYCTFHMLLTGFFKGFMVHNYCSVLICYIRHVKMQLNDVIKVSVDISHL